jgi:hypothetical protein
MGPDQFGEIGSEPWKTMPMETYFPNARSRQRFLSGPKQRFKARRLRGTATASVLSPTGFFGSGRAPLPPLSSMRLLPTAVALCGVPDEQTHHPAGQHDLKVVTVLHLGDNEGQ